MKPSVLAPSASTTGRRNRQAARAVSWLSGAWAVTATQAAMKTGDDCERTRAQEGHGCFLPAKRW